VDFYEPAVPRSETFTILFEAGIPDTGGETTSPFSMRVAGIRPRAVAPLRTEEGAEDMVGRKPVTGSVPVAVDSVVEDLGSVGPESLRKIAAVDMGFPGNGAEPSVAPGCRLQVPDGLREKLSIGGQIC
jgi:hypothetical protein